LKVIILAAGKGKRLQPITNELPKPLVQLRDGFTILEDQIYKAKESGVIDEVVVITGYKSDKITSIISKLKHVIHLKEIFNPLYANTGPLVSMWFALNELIEDDYIIINGDTKYKKNIFENIVQNKESINLAISKKNIYGKDSVKVILKQDKIVKVDKTIMHEEVDAESTGMLMVSGKYNRDVFVNKLKKIILIEKYLSPNIIWHEILNKLIEDGVIIKSIIVHDWEWKEVDTIEDLDNLNVLNK